MPAFKFVIKLHPALRAYDWNLGPSVCWAAGPSGETRHSTCASPTMHELLLQEILEVLGQDFICIRCTPSGSDPFFKPGHQTW